MKKQTCLFVGFCTALVVSNPLLSMESSRKRELPDLSSLAEIHATGVPEEFFCFEKNLEPTKNPYDSSAGVTQKTSLIKHGRKIGQTSVSYNIRTKKAYVAEVSVIEKYRNKGWGTKLLEEVSKDLESYGCEEVELLVLTDQDNQKDLPRFTTFYTRCGFKPDPQNTFLRDGLTMRKTLQKQRKHYEKK